MRIGLHHRAVNMEQTAIDQTSLHALVDRLDKELLKNVGAPTSPGFGEHAVIGDIRIQIKAQEPEEIEPGADLLHQFTLTGDVVEEEQQQQLDDHPRVQRDVAGATIAVADDGDDKGKVQSGRNFTQEVVGSEPVLQVDMVGKQCGLAAAGLGSHHIWEVRRCLMYLIHYIMNIADLGNTPCRRRLPGYEMSGLRRREFSLAIRAGHRRTPLRRGLRPPA